MFVVTGCNEVVAKVIFLHLFVILFTRGVCLPQCMLGYHPPEQTPQEQTLPRADTPRSRHPPEQTPPGADTPWSRHHPWSRPPKQTPPRADTLPEQTPPGSRLQHTVNEWPVRILLECILVLNCSCL